jgi:hypothetical protein
MIELTLEHQLQLKNAEYTIPKASRDELEQMYLQLLRLHLVYTQFTKNELKIRYES